MRARRLAAFFLLVLPACGDEASSPADTSIRLSIAVAAGAELPDELRLTARDDATVLFRDARLPRSGPPKSRGSGRSLGAVRLVVGDVTGDIEISVRGLKAGIVIAEGDVRVRAKKGREVDATVEVRPPETEGARPPPKDASPERPKDAGAG